MGTTTRGHVDLRQVANGADQHHVHDTIVDKWSLVSVMIGQDQFLAFQILAPHVHLFELSSYHYYLRWRHKWFYYSI